MRAPSAAEVAPDIWRLNLPLSSHFLGSVNVHLLRAGDGYALVDCGQDLDECWLALQDQLSQLKVPLTAIHTIILTHSHRDHYGLATRLRDLSGAEIWLHEHDVAFMHHRWLRQAASEELVAWLQRYGFPAEEAVQVVDRVRDMFQAAQPIDPDRTLHGGEDVAIGRYRFEIQWTPGHTPGHVCLYEPRHGLLLVGDHVLEKVAPNVSLQTYTDHNPMPGYLASLEQLAELPIELSLPGHGQPFKDVGVRARQLLKHQLDRRAQALALLDHRALSAYELAALIWADSKPNTWSDFSGPLRRNAVGTLSAHLELLAADGAIKREDGEQVRFARAG